MRDTILLSEFLPSTREAFSLICARYDLWDVDAINYAEFYFILQELPDAEEFFPHGRSATIQRLQTMLSEIAVTKMTHKERP